jgi:SAM-dependent methyltransferase
MDRGVARACPAPSYENSVAAEKRIYENCVDVHRLPPIFHYWSNRYLVPKLEAFGIASAAEMFRGRLDAICAKSRANIVSLGSGNCDLEIDLASALKKNGHDFSLVCVDLNPAMLERGRIAAASTGVSSCLEFVEADLNHWKASAEYDAVLANQSLHHVVNLEGLFDRVKESLRPGGQFLISDMIGRNGHQRWPEALDVTHEFWSKLPPSYRFNDLVGYYEEMYQSWDCSLEGFEGVRSQDILPLLLERFHFRLFVGYGNIIDPFIDRAFGGHFDPDSEWDRSFIDRVHQRDEVELSSGRLKPTHMIAALASDASGEFLGNFVPASCVRPAEQRETQVRARNPYESDAWPHDPREELEIACRRLAETGNEIKQRTRWALDLAKQLDHRTAWSRSLEKDVDAAREWGRRLERELENRTTWAMSLQPEVEKQTEWALGLRSQVERLEAEVEERTAWALRLKSELAGQTSRAGQSEAELHRLLHRPGYLLARLFRGIQRRLRS